MRKLVVAALIAVVLATVVVVVSSGILYESEDPLIPDAPSRDDSGDGDGMDSDFEVPDGFIVNQAGYTVSSPVVSEWNVYDMLSPYCTSSKEVYLGYTVVSDSVTLGPGLYRLAVAGEVFEVRFEGVLERTAEWIYDFKGVKKDVSLSYGIDVSSLLAQKAAADAFNGDGHQRLFSELPAFAIVDDTVSGIAHTLRTEFIRIGGDPSDLQSYADFIASFVQEALPYPDRVLEEDSSSYRGEDYSLYGQDEYWAMPLQTLCVSKGDCEDKSVLLCSLYKASGFDAAIGGKSGHVVAGVALDPFEEVSSERLKELNPFRVLNLTSSLPVEGSCGLELSDRIFYAVETIYGQIPVGYMSGIDFGSSTFWGISGFYPCG